MNAIDYTFNDCPIVTADDGNTYAINENSWNGRYYRECWVVEKSGGGWIWDLKAPTISLRPVERWEVEFLELSKIEENTPEWDAACERVGYEIVN